MKVHYYTSNDTITRETKLACGRAAVNKRGWIAFGTNDITAFAREYRMDTACLACVKRVRRAERDWQNAVSVAFGYAN